MCVVLSKELEPVEEWESGICVGGVGTDVTFGEVESEVCGDGWKRVC